jgi:hypothetical protein
MLLSEENNFLYNLYNTRIIKENPDTLTLGDNYYSYDNSDLGNYTGLMYMNGKFLMSKQIIGHGRLLSYITNNNLEDVPDLIHNFDSFDDIYNLGYSGQTKFRLWPKFKIFSTWDRNFRPEYKPAIDAILDRIKDYNHEYKFDPNLYSGKEDEFKSYDEFVKDELGEDELSAIDQEAREKAKNARLMADMMAGNKPRTRSIDLDSSMPPPRVPAWQRRDGD